MNHPSWWSNMHPIPQSSWSQLLLSGSTSGILLSGNNEDRLGNIIDPNQFQPSKKLGNNWEDQITILGVNPHDHVKQEVSSIKSNSYGQEDDHEEEEEVQANRSANCASWSKVVQVSSPRSCVTTLGSTNNNNNTMLDLSYNYHKEDFRKNQNSDQYSSECNSTAKVVVCKKPRVQSSSSQPPLKVRKEKLGDRITALHQLVSPFGKTDTASVLLEAIGYIRFLQSQVEALSSPYLGQASKHSRNTNKQYVDMEGREKEKQKDLRSRGLCLVPVSCTHQVGSDNGADYWAPSNYSNGF